MNVGLFCSFLALIGVVHGRGMMLLYRPVDASVDCVYSQKLRYDLSFGMGMSDTITLVLRTLSEIDYECEIEIVTERWNITSAVIKLLIVIRYPNSIAYNCMLNPNQFIVLKKKKCFLLCDELDGQDKFATYYTTTSLTRFRFRFKNNSTINTDLNANFYEVTATSARLIKDNKNITLRLQSKKKKEDCNSINETKCIIGSEEFCFTSGVVCDGIKNCGASDWFDERESDCELPIQTLGTTPVIAVAAVIVCAVLAAVHVLIQNLPPTANSFFIFNANEDNRICLDPIFQQPNTFNEQIRNSRRASVIPVFSSNSTIGSDSQEIGFMDSDEGQPSFDRSAFDPRSMRKTSMVTSMSERLTRKLRLVTERMLPGSRRSSMAQDALRAASTRRFSALYQGPVQDI